MKPALEQNDEAALCGACWARARNTQIRVDLQYWINLKSRESGTAIATLDANGLDGSSSVMINGHRQRLTSAPGDGLGWHLPRKATREYRKSDEAE